MADVADDNEEQHAEELENGDAEDAQEDPKATNPRSKRHDLANRAQAIALAEYGIPISDVVRITTIPRRTIYRLRKGARDRGYDPKVSTVLKDSYVMDGKKTGRPRKDRSHLKEMFANKPGEQDGSAEKQPEEQNAQIGQPPLYQEQFVMNRHPPFQPQTDMPSHAIESLIAFQHHAAEANSAARPYYSPYHPAS
ncbi:hypothetical protein MMC25_003899 [Agyrium rufum]|nr:hypothetical protein [Agyrium rufum]